MEDFLFGKDMKKFLITISPLCVVLFILMWVSWGMEGVLTFFGAVLFTVALAFGLTKWMKFVDKHIKD
jgi:hypothetical protein